MPDTTLAAGNPQKADGLEIHVVAMQVLVYDQQADRVHYLNPTAALILELCDGEHSPAEIADLVKEAYGLSDAPSDVVGGCIRTFRQNGIVV